jgi:sugar lactone lactonase YvrE
MDTDPGIRYKGSLYCLHDDLHVTMHRRPVSISNGLAWTSDNKTLYYIDSPEKAMIAWDFDLSKGTLSNERIAFTIDLPNEKFDGQTIDAEGMLWVAIWGGGCVRRYNPKTGEVLGEVNLPCPNITSCCFGGPNFETLYVTTADYGSRSAHPQAGQTFAVTGLGVRGLRFFKFKLSPSK